MTEIPIDLKSLIIKVAELDEKTIFLQGQSNLLLAFIASDPANLTKFATMTKTFLTQPTVEENTRSVAQQLLDAGLTQYLPPQPPLKQQPTPQIHENAKIIQFPKWKNKKTDPKKTY